MLWERKSFTYLFYGSSQKVKFAKKIWRKKLSFFSWSQDEKYETLEDWRDHSTYGKVLLGNKSFSHTIFNCPPAWPVVERVAWIFMTSAFIYDDDPLWKGHFSLFLFPKGQKTEKKLSRVPSFLFKQNFSYEF